MHGRRGERFCSGKRTRAIAPVVGTLILIVVVVTAVGSFAYVLSAFQAQNENSQARLSNVQNDKLQISFVQLYPSDPQTQFQFSISGHVYYVQRVSDTAVDVYDFSTAAYPGIPTKIDGLYRQIGEQIPAWIDLTATAGEMSFARTAPNASFVQIRFSGATWNSMVLTVTNQNTQASGLSAISVNDLGTPSFLYLQSSGNISYVIGNGSLTIPPTANVRVYANIQHFAILKNSTLNINILSLYNNVFSDLLAPPSALISSSMTAPVLSMATSNVVTLDASRSIASSNFVQSYLWRIDVPYASGWNGSWNDYNHVLTTYTGGRTIQYSSVSFFNEYYPHVLTNSTLRATLTVVDSNGLTSMETSVISSVSNAFNLGVGGGGGNTNSECPLSVVSTPVSGNLFWNQCSQDVANLVAQYGWNPQVGLLHDINEPGCNDYVGGYPCDDTYWTTSDNVPTCWTLGDFTYTSIATTCEATNRQLGAFQIPNDGERYEAYVGSPIISGDACCTHTVLLPPNGQNNYPCPQTGCSGHLYGYYPGTTTPYAIQSDAHNGASARPPDPNAGVDIAGPQAINAWLSGNLPLATTIAKNLVARWDGVGVGQSGGGYSTWQLGQVMFVMRILGFDSSSSPIMLNNGIVTTYSAVFTSMETELWSLLFGGGYLPNSYNASGQLGGHDPENQDAGLLPFSYSVYLMVHGAFNCVNSVAIPCPN